MPGKLSPLISAVRRAGVALGSTEMTERIGKTRSLLVGVLTSGGDISPLGSPRRPNSFELLDEDVGSAPSPRLLASPPARSGIADCDLCCPDKDLTLRSLSSDLRGRCAASVSATSWSRPRGAIFKHQSSNECTRQLRRPTPLLRFYAKFPDDPGDTSTTTLLLQKLIVIARSTEICCWRNTDAMLGKMIVIDEGDGWQSPRYFSGVKMMRARSQGEWGDVRHTNKRKRVTSKFTGQGAAPKCLDRLL